MERFLIGSVTLVVLFIFFASTFKLNSKEEYKKGFKNGIREDASKED